MALQTIKIIPFQRQSTHAFQIFSSAAEEGNNFSIRVYPGTINNILSKNIIGNKGLLTSFPISQNSLQYVKAKATTNGTIVNSVEIKVDRSPVSTQVPVPFGLPSSFEILLGVVYNSEVYQVVRDNIVLGGKVQHVLKADSPDSLPFIPYLIWG